MSTSSTHITINVRSPKTDPLGKAPFKKFLQRVPNSPLCPGILLDKILTDERWDLKFIGMQIVIEGLALAAFQMLKGLSKDPLLTQLLHYVIRDEARHVTFGINYLEDFIKTLTPEEIE